jgi:HEPN superfamily AbiV-like protein
MAILGTEESAKALYLCLWALGGLQTKEYSLRELFTEHRVKQGLAGIADLVHDVGPIFLKHMRRRLDRIKRKGNWESEEYRLAGLQSLLRVIPRYISRYRSHLAALMTGHEQKWRSVREFGMTDNLKQRGLYVGIDHGTGNVVGPTHVSVSEYKACKTNLVIMLILLRLFRDAFRDPSAALTSRDGMQNIVDRVVAENPLPTQAHVHEDRLGKG